MRCCLCEAQEGAGTHIAVACGGLEQQHAAHARCCGGKAVHQEHTESACASATVWHFVSKSSIILTCMMFLLLCRQT